MARPNDDTAVDGLNLQRGGGVPITEPIRWASDRSIASLYAARALRDFGDGFVAVLLPVYLVTLGLGAFEVGVIATLALLGSALMTLLIGVLGPRVDNRRLLILASGLMIATGIAFAASNTYAVVLLVAFIGTINPSSGSVSIFVPLEHAALSRAVQDNHRTKMFARYSLVGALAAAFGALASGPDVLAAVGVSQTIALKGMLVAYAVLGAFGGLMHARIPADPLPPRTNQWPHSGRRVVSSTEWRHCSVLTHSRVHSRILTHALDATTESAPYLEALVVSSWRVRPMLWAAEQPSESGGPFTEICP